MERIVRTLREAGKFSGLKLEVPIIPEALKSPQALKPKPPIFPGFWIQVCSGFPVLALCVASHYSSQPQGSQGHSL